MTVGITLNYLYRSIAALNFSSLVRSAGLSSNSQGKRMKSRGESKPPAVLGCGGQAVRNTFHRANSHRSRSAFSRYSMNLAFIPIHSNGVRSRKSPSPNPITPTPKFNSSVTSYLFFYLRLAQVPGRLVSLSNHRVNSRDDRWCNQ